jgi:hypothetical protein
MVHHSVDTREPWTVEQRNVERGEPVDVRGECASVEDKTRENEGSGTVGSAQHASMHALKHVEGTNAVLPTDSYTQTMRRLTTCVVCGIMYTLTASRAHRHCADFASCASDSWARRSHRTWNNYGELCLATMLMRRAAHVQEV